ncbi:MAG: hypothetical protein IPM07_12420 [Anaerolineales bacterium]|nr:hypothetical protein [Anaerolineales bacterium]
MTQPMTSLERTRTVLAGGIPDRVPVDLHNFMMVAEDSGMPFPEFFQNGEAMAEGQIKAWREFGHDVLILENGTAALAEACGAQVEYMEGSAPVCHARLSGRSMTSTSLKCPIRTKRFPHRKPEDDAHCGAGDRRQSVHHRAPTRAPFSLAAMLLGMEEFLLRLAQADGAQRAARRWRRPGVGEEATSPARIFPGSHHTLRLRPD